MESLNSYVSDGESDSSTTVVVRKKNTHDEADADCEPITMDMSEESSDEASEEETNEKNYLEPEVKRKYSRSLSPSPSTSESSRGSSVSTKKKSEEKEQTCSRERSRDKRNDDRKRDDRDKYKKDSSKSYRRDDDRDRRHKDDKKDKYRERDRDSDRHRRHERKRNRSRSRSRSRSYDKHRDSRRKHRSRSRSRSHDRHRRRSSPRRSHQKHKSPYRTRRSRSGSGSREKTRSFEWKSSSKLKVLEKLGIELKVPACGIDISQSGIVSSVTTAASQQLTPQLLLQKSMEEQVEKVKSATGIELPSYYNPVAVNPTKYAEQIQKRRLLWGNKDKPVKTEENGANNNPATETNKGTGTVWQGATFGGDQDGKMTAKFKRLMGIKKTETANNTPETVKVGGSDLIKKQEEMFNSMESQYEVARLATHSHRGLGLGFGTFQPR